MFGHDKQPGSGFSHFTFNCKDMLFETMYRAKLDSKVANMVHKLNNFYFNIVNISRILFDGKYNCNRLRSV